MTRVNMKDLSIEKMGNAYFAMTNYGACVASAYTKDECIDRARHFSAQSKGLRVVYEVKYRCWGAYEADIRRFNDLNKALEFYENFEYSDKPVCKFVSKKTYLKYTSDLTFNETW